MNSAALSLKKSKCWIWVVLDSTVGKVLGFVCGSRSIKMARELFKQWKGLPTTGYGTDFLKTYENLIPTALHPQGKIFTTQIESLNCRLRHYLARLHHKTLC
jgi:IS1 family transposase